MRWAGISESTEQCLAILRDVVVASALPEGFDASRILRDGPLSDLVKGRDIIRHMGLGRNVRQGVSCHAGEGMRVTILGSTGGVGRCLVRQALAAGLTSPQSLVLEALWLRQMGSGCAGRGDAPRDFSSRP